MGFVGPISMLRGLLMTGIAKVSTMVAKVSEYISRGLSYFTKTEPLRIHERETEKVLNLPLEPVAGKVILRVAGALDLALLVYTIVQGLTFPMLVAFGTFLMITVLSALLSDIIYYNGVASRRLSFRGNNIPSKHSIFWRRKKAIDSRFRFEGC